MSALTIRVADDISDKLDRIARNLDQSPSEVASKAIEDFVAREESQLAEIEAGVAEADRGDFATENEISTVLRKHLGSRVP